MTTETYNPKPATVDEALERWDDNRPVFTVEMGGLGPGYEQVLQITVMELLRRHGDEDLPEPGSDDSQKVFDGWREDVSEINEEKGLRLSGAQAGAARNLAYNYIHNGYRETLDQVDDGRLIQVSKRTPQG